ncbi:MAG: hypothetical protein JJU12_04970 [Chlamydiales bacterium]|nr:hypothetical protein [Chlamydiales bacterium]
MTTPVHEKTFPSDERVKLPRPFILRRLHSLLGLWLVIYVSQHLLMNSQTGLFFKDNGTSYLRMVNSIHHLPFLQVLEVIVLGVPFLIHGLWGIKYALTSKSNSFRGDGTKPALPQYRRNRAFTWQRVTAWLLLVGIIAHVVQMRFIESPIRVHAYGQTLYMTRLIWNPAFAITTEKLNVQLYDQAQIAEKERELKEDKARLEALRPESETFPEDDAYFQLVVEVQGNQEWLQAARRIRLKKEGQFLAVAPNAGAAFFLIVQQAFMNPMVVILYSILVVAAAYHAFNGLWTFMIVWGITLTRRSQKTMRAITTTLMGIVTFLGLMSAWGTYWTNLFLR